MKKLLILLFSIFFLSSTAVIADDIFDFSIEGISIGDSLLDYMTEEEILKEIEENKDGYYYLNEPKKYLEIYIWNDFSIYDMVSVFIKNNSNVYLTNKNEEYKILSIRGGIAYDDDLEGCVQKRNEIAEDFSEMLFNAEKWDTIFPKSDDPSGRSTIDMVNFELERNLVQLACTDYEKTFKIKNNIVDSLSVILRPKEIRRWLNDK